MNWQERGIVRDMACGAFLAITCGLTVGIVGNPVRKEQNNSRAQGRSKSSPVTGLEWPRGFQEIKVPRFHDNGTGWWQGCQPYAPAAFTPRKYSWYSFLLEAESTPGQ